MKKTSIIQKIIPSILNVLIVLVITSPVWIVKLSYDSKAVIIVSTFFIYNLFFLIFFHNRDLGMMIVKTYWQKDYPLANQIVYAILYTASFATLFIWIWFPFDTLLINTLFLQLPCVLVTGTTLHGYLAGEMATVTKKS